MKRIVPSVSSKKISVPFHLPLAGFRSRCFVSLRGSFAWLAMRNDPRNYTKEHEE